jgi:hypothetical protein
MYMKKLIKKLSLAGGIVCAVLLYSCSDMNELSDRFLDEGEIIYAYVADSVAAHTGFKRVEIEIFIGTRRVDKVRVYWNNYQDYTDVQVGSQAGVFRTVIEGLEESTYLFHVVSFDSYGNKSLPVEVSGEAVGDNFKALLRNRLVASAVYTADNEVTVKWGSVPNYSIDCELTYTNTANQSVKLSVPVDETVTVIPDWKSGLSYSTRFIPGDGALDTFSVETVTQDVWKEFKDKSAWTVHSYSGGYHNNDFRPENAIDGNRNTTWHTSVGGFPPADITIDFGPGSALRIDGIVFQNRLDDMGALNHPKKVRWEVSNDLNEWTTILAFEEMTNTKDELWLPCTTSATGRYLHFYMETGWQNLSYSYIGEMGIFQK